MKMNTRLLMTTSAVVLAIIGLCLTFLSAEIAAYILVPSTIVIELLIQILGALYFGFAMLNWMAKRNIMGGIYNRPIAIANVAHFVIGALSLIKVLLKHPEVPSVIWLLTVLYTIFAALFGMVLIYSPATNKKSIVAN